MATPQSKLSEVLYLVELPCARVSRNTRPLAPARPQRPRSLHAIRVMHTPGIVAGVAGNRSRADGHGSSGEAGPTRLSGPTRSRQTPQTRQTLWHTYSLYAADGNRHPQLCLPAGDPGNQACERRPRPKDTSPRLPQSAGRLQTAHPRTAVRDGEPPSCMYAPRSVRCGCLPSAQDSDGRVTVASFLPAESVALYAVAGRETSAVRRVTL